MFFAGQLLTLRNNNHLVVTPDYTAAEFASVQRAARFCSRRMQNDVLPETLVPLTIHENGCLNLKSSLMDGRATIRPYPLLTLPYLYPKGRTYFHLTATSWKMKFYIFILRFGNNRDGSAPSYVWSSFLCVHSRRRIHPPSSLSKWCPWWLQNLPISTRCNWGLCPLLYRRFDCPRSQCRAPCMRSSLAHHSHIQISFELGAIWRSCPPICPCFNQLGFTPLMNVYHCVRVTIYCVLSQPVEVAIQMYPGPRGDVSPYHLIRISQTRHVFLCSILPRDSIFVIAGKHEVHHLDARGGQKSIQFCGLRNYFGHSSIVPVCQFPPHVVGRVWPDPVWQHYTWLLHSLVLSLHSAKTIPHTAPRLRNCGPSQDNHEPPLQIKKCVTMVHKKPLSPVSGLYWVTWYSYTSYISSMRYPFQTANLISSITHVPVRARSSSRVCTYSSIEE